MTDPNPTPEALAELKACPVPWCASHDRSDQEVFEAHRPILMPGSLGDRWAVACPVCPIQTPYVRTEAEAIAAWNTRPEPRQPASEPLPDAVERVARALAEHDGIQICSDASYRHSSYGLKARAALSAMPASSGEVGQVVAWLRKQASGDLMLPAYAEFLNAYAEAIERGSHRGTDGSAEGSPQSGEGEDGR